MAGFRALPRRKAAMPILIIAWKIPPGLKAPSRALADFDIMHTLRERYLTHIKMLSSKWPHLQLLADFMDVGTTPVRWNANVPGGYPVDNKPRGELKLEDLAPCRLLPLSIYRSR